MDEIRRKFQWGDIMKFKKKDLLIVAVTFLVSLIIILACIVEIYYKQVPQVSNAAKISHISKVEVALDVFGVKIPDEKVKIYNSMVSEKEKIDYSKIDSTTRVNSIELIILFAAILTIIITLPYYSIKSRIIKRKAIKKDKELRKRYIEKYSLIGKNYYTKCIDSTLYNKDISGKSLVAWQEENGINFVNREYKNDIGIVKLNLDDIVCFSRYGDFYTSLNISGGDSSYGRAAMGYLLAGAAGAIIASRNSISSRTEVHDNRETLIFINEGEGEKYLFFEPDFYDFLMHIIPSKEINHKVNVEAKTKNSSKLDELNKLAELKEKGIIDELEFSKLKNELINKN